MRILFLGDIVGRQARGHVIAETATLKENLECDFVITNCENSAGGFGVTPDICNALFDAGSDVPSGLRLAARDDDVDAGRGVG